MRDSWPVSAVIVAVIACNGCTSTSSNDSRAVPESPPTKIPPPVGTTDPPPTDPTNDPDAGSCSGIAGELSALTVQSLTGDVVPLCRFKGNVLLIVNVASQCGYTPQYAPLQTQYDKYRASGFYVLGFPSRSFNQEFADAGDVSTFCTNTYHITFPMFAIANVNAPDEQPVYGWLKGQWHPTHSTETVDVQWNFEKYLVSRDGKVTNRFLTAITPDDPTVIAAVEAELAKPFPP